VRGTLTRTYGVGVPSMRNDVRLGSCLGEE
jgi:hypothetical protein